MKREKLLMTILSTSMCVGIFCGRLLADDKQSMHNSNGVAADNTKMNEHDRKHSKLTADQATNKVSDRELMRKIRREIMKDNSLSIYGHNVKVIARNGHVTLKGTVHTEDEKRNIFEKANSVAGSENVTNKLMVKGS